VQPKYLNTPQTVLFDKSRVLYGLDLARDSIRSADATVIVEGYVDVITAHQHGFRNVVAPLGTALTTSHVDMIKKLTHNVYLALDADAAGQRATLRGLSAFEGAPDEETAGEAQPVVTAHGLVRWQRDVTLRIIKMPPGRDPDDVIKSDPQQWQALLDAAQPVMEFYIDAYTADLDLSQPQQQRTALERLIPLVRQLDSTQQRVYVARLERVIGIRAELILDLLRASPQQRQQRKSDRKARQQQQPTSSQQPPASDAQAAPKRKNGVVQRENYLLALLFRHPSALRPVEMVLTHELQSFANLHGLLGDSIERLLEQTANRQVWQAWQDADMPVVAMAPNGHMPDWAQPLDAALQAQLETVAAVPVPEHQEYRYVQDAENCVRYLRREQVRRWQRRLSQQAQDSDDPQTREQATALLSELQGYLARVNIPRRNSSWTDVRDTLQRPDD
jgi:DNA primase